PGGPSGGFKDGSPRHLPGEPRQFGLQRLQDALGLRKIALGAAQILFGPSRDFLGHVSRDVLRQDQLVPALRLSSPTLQLAHSLQQPTDAGFRRFELGPQAVGLFRKASILVYGLLALMVHTRSAPSVA